MTQREIQDRRYCLEVEISRLKTLLKHEESLLSSLQFQCKHPNDELSVECQGFNHHYCPDCGRDDDKKL